MARCIETRLEFEISQLEEQLLQNLGLPAPQELPSRRMQHRLTFRNERTLYKRTSSRSGKSIVSIYAPDSAHTVYATDEWWSDAWDGEDYGREFDFNRPFFEQFRELHRVVPRIAVFNVNPHNSDYCQQAYNNKNCYLCMVVKDCEDSQYVSHSNRVRDCYDCDYVQNAELCFDCLDSDKLYACIGCRHCQNSNELIFCLDCIGCSNCIGCSGLRNQKYCIFNEQVSKAQYAEFQQNLKLGSHAGFQQQAAAILKRVSAASNKVDYNINAVDSSGTNLINAGSCFECNDSFQIERCSYCTWIFESNHCADVYGMGTSDWVYASLGVENLHRGAFNTFVSDSGDSFYSDLCFYCRDIFGCVGLRKKKNCILNKQYSTEEYANLRSAIVEHMQRTGEWGKFFPAEVSPFAYNESVAAERFPLPKSEIAALGYRWREPDAKEYQPMQIELPDAIESAEDAICKQTLACAATGKNYRITQQELEFYRKINLPLPRLCPDARYAQRMKRRTM